MLVDLQCKDAYCAKLVEGSPKRVYAITTVQSIQRCNRVVVARKPVIERVWSLESVGVAVATRVVVVACIVHKKHLQMDLSGSRHLVGISVEVEHEQQK